MTIKKRIIIAVVSLAVAIGIILVGASFYNFLFNDKIIGKIIIVQGDAHANKMALIQVLAIRRDDAINWRDQVSREGFRMISETQKEIKENAAALSATIQRFDAKIAELEEDRDMAELAKGLANTLWLVDALDQKNKKDFFALISRIRFPLVKEIEVPAMASEWHDVRDILRDKMIPLIEKEIILQKLTKEKNVKKTKAEGFSRVEQQRRNLRQFISPESLSRMPNWIRPIASDMTDDSGEYSLRLPRGDYYIFASGSRRVFSGLEYYSWAAPVNVPSQKSEKCLLGNMNLVGVANDDLWAETIEAIRLSEESL